MTMIKSIKKMTVGTITDLTSHTPSSKEKTHFVTIICNELQKVKGIPWGLHLQIELPGQLWLLIHNICNNKKKLEYSHTMFSGRWNRYSCISLFNVNASLSHEHEAGKGNLSLSSALLVVTGNSAEFSQFREYQCQKEWLWCLHLSSHFTDKQ